MFKIRKELCAFDSGDWNQDKDEFACPSATNVYHCIVNEKNQSGEICIQQVWVQRGYCPEYNTDANTVDTVPCDQTDGCPQNPFQSNEVYKYPVCINKTYHEQLTFGGVDGSYPPWLIPIISVAVVVVIISVISIVCFFRRRQKSGEQEEDVPLLRKSEIPFFKTSAFHEALKFVRNGGKFLCFHGRWGSGKTTTAKQVYLYVTKREPVVIENIAEFDVSSCDDSVIIEEPISKHLSNEKLETIMFKIKSLCSAISNKPGNFAIFTTSDAEWKPFSDKIWKMLLESEIGPLRDISLNFDSLSRGDRNQILHKLFGDNDTTKSFREIEDVAIKFNELHIGFAETCILFLKCGISETSSILFFNRPLSYLKLYLGKMCTSSEEVERSKFMMLVFMSLNQRKINLNKSKTRLGELFEACDLSLEKLHLASIIPEEYVLKEEEEVYVLQHDVIQRMTLVVFGTHHFEKLVRFSSWNAVPDWIQEKPMLLKRKINEYTEPLNEIQPILEISHNQWTELRDKCESIQETENSVP